MFARFYIYVLNSPSTLNKVKSPSNECALALSAKWSMSFKTTSIFHSSHGNKYNAVFIVPYQYRNIRFIEKNRFSIIYMAKKKLCYILLRSYCLYTRVGVPGKNRKQK